MSNMCIYVCIMQLTARDICSDELLWNSPTRLLPPQLCHLSPLHRLRPSPGSHLSTPTTQWLSVQLHATTCSQSFGSSLRRSQHSAMQRQVGFPFPMKCSHRINQSKTIGNIFKLKCIISMYN